MKFYYMEKVLRHSQDRFWKFPVVAAGESGLMLSMSAQILSPDWNSLRLPRNVIRKTRVVYARAQFHLGWRNTEMLSLPLFCIPNGTTTMPGFPETFPLVGLTYEYGDIFSAWIEWTPRPPSRRCDGLRISVKLNVLPKVTTKGVSDERSFCKTIQA